MRVESKRTITKVMKLLMEDSQTGQRLERWRLSAICDCDLDPV